MGFLIRAAMAVLGLWLATQVLSGLTFTDTGSLVAAALLLGIVNAVVRPLVLLLTLPLTVLSLGFFLLVVNAGMVGLVAWLLDGFRVSGFWTAVGTSVIVGITSWMGSSVAGDGRGTFQVYTSRRNDGDQ